MRPKAPIIAAILVAALVVVAGVVLVVVQPWSGAPSVPPVATGTTDALEPSSAARAPAIDPTTHVLDDGGPASVVVVEFIDFECEACAAVYPEVERIREDYAGEITFAIRYFPLPSHVNSTNAAIAAEAAARQGRLEDMYSLLLETQLAWGEAQTSEEPRFREYAETLGLDMAQFDADVASDEVRARVELDVQAGIALGVQSTPSIFIDDEPLELRALQDIEAAVRAAIEAP